MLQWLKANWFWGLMLYGVLVAASYPLIKWLIGPVDDTTEEG